MTIWQVELSFSTSSTLSVLTGRNLSHWTDPSCCCCCPGFWAPPCGPGSWVASPGPAWPFWTISGPLTRDSSSSDLPSLFLVSSCPGLTWCSLLVAFISARILWEAPSPATWWTLSINRIQNGCCWMWVFICYVRVQLAHILVSFRVASFTYKNYRLKSCFSDLVRGEREWQIIRPFGLWIFCKMNNEQIIGTSCAYIGFKYSDSIWSMRPPPPPPPQIADFYQKNPNKTNFSNH